MSPNVIEKAEYRCFKYLIIGHDMGHRCGYVSLPSWHKLYKVDEEDFGHMNVHGGITFCEIITQSPNFDKGHWIGFDCVHGGDARDETLMSEEYNEVYKKINFVNPGIVRDDNFVRSNIKDLINQLLEVTDHYLIIRDKIRI